MKTKRIPTSLTLLIFMVIILAGCDKNEPPVVEEVDISPEPPVEVVEEVEEEKDLDDLARELLEDQGEIVDIKRLLVEDVPLLEVVLKSQEGKFVYRIDPIKEEIISREKFDQLGKLSLDEAHFLARQALGGTTELRGVWTDGDDYRFLLEKEGVGYEIEVTSSSSEGRILGERELESLTGAVNMGLLEALHKLEVIYGKLELRELYYRPGDDHSSYVVIEGEQEISGEWHLRSFEMETYGGVIWEN